MCFGIGDHCQSGGTLMALPRQLYAVVSHGAQKSPARKPNAVELRAQKLREIETKKAIDRANEVLDRLEQRLAHYDVQIQLVRKDYLQPLERRRACAGRRIARLGRSDPGQTVAGESGSCRRVLPGLQGGARPKA